MNASYQFFGATTRRAHCLGTRFWGGLRARTAKISVRYQPPSIWNSESSEFGVRGKQKGGNGVQALTAAHSWQILVGCEWKSRGLSIKEIKMLSFCVLLGPCFGRTGFVHNVPTFRNRKILEKVRVIIKNEHALCIYSCKLALNCFVYGVLSCR